MEKSRDEIEKLILDFLHEHGEDYFTCALATCWENEPRNTPIDGRNDGLNIYFVADPGGKLDNIRRNPQVCLAIFNPCGERLYEKRAGSADVGKAQIITMKEDPEELKRVLTL